MIRAEQPNRGVLDISMPLTGQFMSYLNTVFRTIWVKCLTVLRAVRSPKLGTLDLKGLFMHPSLALRFCAFLTVCIVVLAFTLVTVSSRTSRGAASAVEPTAPLVDQTFV